MNNRELDESRVRAQEIVLEAGKIIRAAFGRVKKEQVSQKGLHDYVTEVDLQVEKMICSRLSRSFPHFAILTEEQPAPAEINGYCWVLDPLDGTANFIHSIPFVSISLALTWKQCPLTALVYDPLHEELFWAVQGRGAFYNERQIRVSCSPKIDSGFAATGFPFRRLDGLSNYCWLLEHLMRRLSGLRRCGSAALDLVYTACGRFDFFFEAHLMPWDFMAGVLIVKEAGGEVSDFRGNQLRLEASSVLAGNGAIHSELLAVIKNYYSDEG